MFRKCWGNGDGKDEIQSLIEYIYQVFGYE